jgi:GABA permease
MVVTIGGAAVIVVIVTLLTRPAIGGAVAALFIGVGLGFLWRDLRQSGPPMKAEVAPHEAGVYEILVVANQTSGGPALIDEIANRAKGRNTEVTVVAPALGGSRLQHLASETDQARAEAEQRLDACIQAIQRLGIKARGEVGDEDPNVAMEDALGSTGADEVIISTHTPERSSWLERGVVEKARAEVDLPVTHVIVDVDA